MKFARQIVLMYYIVNKPPAVRRIFMNEIVNFFKEIFMLKSEDHIKVGLTQFKTETPIEKAVKKPSIPPKAEVKLSDLMRRSY